MAARSFCRFNASQVPATLVKRHWKVNKKEIDKTVECEMTLDRQGMHM